MLAALLQVYAAGDITECRDGPARQSVAAQTAALIPPGATVLMLGDATYRDSTQQELQACYGPTWGVHRERTLAVPGNHDYIAGRIDDFVAYFGPGTGPQGHFARRLGDWLVIGLDSRDSLENLDQQYAWLEQTLAQHNDVRCALAMWHAPVFSSGLHRGQAGHMRRFFALLDAHGVDLTLHAHEHFYESFGPLDADGRRSRAGMRSFVVGTGGANLRGFWRPPYASRARLLRHGVLRLTLGDGAFAWDFIDVKGVVADSGAAGCR